MKTIQIHHIAKTEGHMGFVGALVSGDFARARIETEEGARLLEGVLFNRAYFEAPVVTARICGVCPIVHNLCSIKALENALRVKPTKEIIVLRKLLLHGQWIHSHALHAFFLSFPDLVGISNNIALVKKYGAESKLALELRKWALDFCKIIGGRTTHPVNSVVGGFNVAPDLAELELLIAQLPDMLQSAKKIFSFLTKHKLPKFENRWTFAALKNGKEYSCYDGKIHFSDGNEYISPELAMHEIEERIIPGEKVKRVFHNEQTIMTSSIARINTNFSRLNPAAKKAWTSLKIKLPSYNAFHNIPAQATEILHSLEEIEKLFKEYRRMTVKKGFDKKLKVDFKLRAGKGSAILEAPRGILYHHYELDKQGNILNSDIIPPTTTFLANLEHDLTVFLPTVSKLPAKKRDLLIKTLIRAYDPCISCATH